jgi:hypothetical protein
MSPLSAALSLVSLVLALGAPAPRHHHGLCLVTQEQRAAVADEAAVAGSLAYRLGRTRERLEAGKATTQAARLAAAVLGASEHVFARAHRNLLLRAHDWHCRTVL